MASDRFFKPTIFRRKYQPDIYGFDIYKIAQSTAKYYMITNLKVE